MEVLIGFIILIISIFMVINAGWNTLLIPLLMISFFVYVVLMDTLVWKKQRRKNRSASARPDKSPASEEGTRSETDAASDSPETEEDNSQEDDSTDYSGDGGDFGGGGSSGSW